LAKYLPERKTFGAKTYSEKLSFKSYVQYFCFLSLMRFGTIERTWTHCDSIWHFPASTCSISVRAASCIRNWNKYTYEIYL